jgi:hypothetical protein
MSQTDLTTIQLNDVIYNLVTDIFKVEFDKTLTGNSAMGQAAYIKGQCARLTNFCDTLITINRIS